MIYNKLFRFMPYVESRMKESLRAQGRVDKLAEVDLSSALDLMIEKGDWANLLETASQHGPPLLHKYVAIYASHLIKVSNYF